MISLYEFFFTINSDFDRPERKGHGAKVPGNERARERVGQGANRPESYWPIPSRERIGPGAKRLGTDPRHFGTLETGPKCPDSSAFCDVICKPVSVKCIFLLKLVMSYRNC